LTDKRSLGRFFAFTSRTWSYTYYSTGELKNQTDAKGQVIAFQYDKLGRMTNRTDTCGAGSAADGCSSGTVKSNVTWIYDTAANGVGQLDNVQDSVTGYAKLVAYDSLGRTAQTVVSPSVGEAYYQRVNYDAYGRVARQYDASGPLNGITNVYNANGYLSQIVDAASNQPYYTVNAMDAMGHVTQETNGAVTTTRTYDPAMGRLSTINSTVVGLNTLQNLEYRYDAIGNMLKRIDHLNGDQTETFTYDELNRLNTDVAGGNASATTTYDSFGNIVSKNGVTYTYGGGSSGCSGAGSGAGVHAALSMGANTYTYDCNGNNRAGDGRTIQYSVFDKPTSISKGSFTSTFNYDPDRAYYKRTDNNNGQLTSITTIGNVEKVTLPDGSYELRRYVAGALVSTKYSTGLVQTNSTNQYLLKDHLGSTDAIIDQHGNAVGATGNTVKQKQSFDPWGLRRDTSTWAPMTTSLLAQFDHSTTNKGFTGHEMLDELGIIHMQGRIYDPRMGRFLQADPTVQFAMFTQSYNRYSYTVNNPLIYTDPTGYDFWSSAADPFGLGDKAARWAGDNVDVIFNVAMDIAIVVGCGGQPACFVPAITAATTAEARANGVPFNQALQQGAIAGASAFAFDYIGGQFADMSSGESSEAWIDAGAHGGKEIFLTPGQFAGKVMTEAAVGGVMSVLQGGKFGSGFIGAGVSSAFAGELNSLGNSDHSFSIKQLAAATILGGTASALTGGKFANGAITAAFENAFNQQSGRPRQSISNAGLQSIADTEGFSETVYQDQAGNDTIGFGHKLAVDEAGSYSDGITRDQGLQLLRQDISGAERAVNRLVTASLSQSQFDALVSFTYNVGSGNLASSTLLRQLNGGNYAGAADQFSRWNRVTINGQSTVSDGLTNRRANERCTFLGGC